MSSDAQGSVLEILEHRGTDQVGVVIPIEIRLNGQALLCPPDTPVTVHEIAINDQAPVLVTLTVYARRIIIGAEQDPPGADPRP